MTARGTVRKYWLRCQSAASQVARPLVEPIGIDDANGRAKEATACTRRLQPVEVLEAALAAARIKNSGGNWPSPPEIHPAALEAMTRRRQFILHAKAAL